MIQRFWLCSEYMKDFWDVALSPVETLTGEEITPFTATCTEKNIAYTKIKVVMFSIFNGKI